MKLARFFVFLLVSTSPALGQEGEIITESESMLRMVQAGVDRTKIASNQEPDTLTNQEIMIRQINRVSLGKWNLETNLYGVLVNKSLYSSSEQISAPDNFRSSQLGRTWHDSTSTQGVWAIDQFYLRHQSDRLVVTLGRQAVNWATTSFFVPNDFFAPFRAEAFFRVYKAGVDAALLEYALNDLSMLSLLYVAGYRAKTQSSLENEWSPEQSSALMRYSINVLEWDIAVILGEVQELRTFAWGLQGELPLGIGLRLSGNRQQHREKAAAYRERFSAAISLERMLEGDITLQAESFYQSAGASSVAAYPTRMALGLQYGGQSYSAFGVGKQWTPLTRGQYLILANHTDGSSQFLTFHGHSLSDEAEVALSAAGSIGRSRDHQGRVTEFGQSPYSYALAMTAYW